MMSVPNPKFSTAEAIVELCAQKGYEDVILSPGSRNSSLISGFLKNKSFRCLSVHDERSAGYRALGFSLSSGKPGILVCTSGTAVLNYAPAIAEAYYQKIPLLIITADRPESRIDQLDGQTIRQKNIYQNFISDSFCLQTACRTSEEKRHFFRLANRALNLPLIIPGPVHLNLPLTDPTEQNASFFSDSISIIDEPIVENLLNLKSCEEILKIWKASEKKIILVGQHPPDEELFTELKRLAASPNVVILNDLLANFPCTDSIRSFDRILKTASDLSSEKMTPDLLVVFGGQVVSKEIKNFLRRTKNICEQWRIDKTDPYIDTFEGLTKAIRLPPVSFLKLLSETAFAGKSSKFKSFWFEKDESVSARQNQFFKNQTLSDFSAFERIAKKIPEGYAIHLSNSMCVRYAQFFSFSAKSIFFSNRGTSGIDGCLSTAVGYAQKSDRNTLSIIGDTAFFYDSNALWIDKIPENFRIIIINNSGGGIFRIIEPESTDSEKRRFLEAKHRRTAKGIATHFSVNYFSAKNISETEQGLDRLFSSEQKQCAILEIFSDLEFSATCYQNFFNFLSEKKHIGKKP